MLRMLVPLLLAVVICGGVGALLWMGDGEGGNPRVESPGESGDSGGDPTGALPDLADSGDPGSSASSGTGNGDPGDGATRNGAVRNGSSGTRAPAKNGSHGSDGTKGIGDGAPAIENTTVGSGTGRWSLTRSSGPRSARERDFSDADDGDWNLDQVRGRLDTELVMVEGTVVVERADGTTSKDASGSFRARCSQGAVEASTRVPFQDGRFSSLMPANTTLRVDQLRDEERSLRVEFHPHRVRRASRIEIKAFEDAAFRIIVQDSETSSPLSDILVLRPGSSGLVPPHPGNLGRVVARDLTSPVSVGGILQDRFAWVGAPGYTYRRIEIPEGKSRSEGERTVALERSGMAWIELRNVRPGTRARLRLREGERTSGSPICEYSLRELAPENGSLSLSIEGLKPATYRARVELGESSLVRVLGEGEIQVNVAATSELLLDLEDEPESLDPVPLSGRILLPELGEDALVILHVTPQQLDGAGVQRKVSLARGKMTEEDPLTLAWDAGEVLPGRYVFEVEPFQLRFLETVSNSEENVLDLEIPELGDVLVCAQDAKTGDEFELTSLSWQGDAPFGFARPSLRSAPLDEDSGCHRFLAPVGKVTIAYGADGVRRGTKTFDVEPGENTVKLVLSRYPGFQLRLRNGDTEVKIPARQRVEVEAVDGAGKFGWTEAVGGALNVYVSAPGTYTVTIATLTGYEAIEPFEVVVYEGELTDTPVQVFPR